jgi:hypothetical protein
MHQAPTRLLTSYGHVFVTRGVAGGMWGVIAIQAGTMGSKGDLRGKKS